jgi:hypothetical protein
MKQLYLLVLLAGINFSCEKEATISYSIINQSAQSVKVVFFNTNAKDKATYQKKDSVLIEANAEKLIVIQGKGLSRVSNSKETGTYLTEFKYIDVYQQNTKSKTDFLLSNKWNYTEKNKHAAEYKCIVTQSDF